MNDLEFTTLPGVPTPERKTELSAGMDITANSIITAYRGDREITPENLERMRATFKRGTIKLRGFERVLFGTGVFIKSIDPNTELQVRPRSGMAIKRGLTVLNSPGTVDADYLYPKEIGVILYNTTPHFAEVVKGERIAQLVHASVITHGESDQKRTSGFGSTN